MYQIKDLETTACRQSSLFWWLLSRPRFKEVQYGITLTSPLGNHQAK